MSRESSSALLRDVILAGVDYRLYEVHTALPGEIQKYNSDDQTAQVRIAIDREIAGEQIAFPILDGIPVVFPRTSKGGITFPLEKGDSVLLVFNERNLDKFRSTGSGFVPNDARKFDINDAVAIPGFYPDKGKVSPSQKKATEVRGEKLFVGNPSELTTAIITSGAGPGTPVGKPVNVTPESLGLIEIISALIDLVDGAVYGITPAGPTGGGGGIDTESSTALQGLKSDLEKLKV